MDFKNMNDVPDEDYKNRMAALKAVQDEKNEKYKKYVLIARIGTIAAIFGTFFFIFKWRKINPIHAIWATVLYILIGVSVMSAGLFSENASSRVFDKVSPILFFPFLQIYGAITELGRSESTPKNGDISTKA